MLFCSYLGDHRDVLSVAFPGQFVLLLVVLGKMNLTLLLVRWGVGRRVGNVGVGELLQGLRGG